MVSVTVVSDLDWGVPKSVSWISDITILLFRGLQLGRCRAKVFPEMFQRAHDGVGRKSTEGAERAELHGVAEVLDHGEIFGDAFAADDLVDGLYTARRADPARRALAAGFDRAKRKREARLLRHIDGVIEHDNATMADQAIARGKGLVIEWRIEQRAGKIGPERTADLHGARRAPREGAAADVVDELAERDAEGGLEQAAVFDVSGELDRHGATRASHTEIGIGLRAFGEDEGDRREGEHVVDHGGIAEQALVRRQRRLGAHDAAAPLQAFEQRGLLAADIGAGADANFKVETVCGAADAIAEQPRAFRGGDRRIHG